MRVVGRVLGLRAAAALLLAVLLATSATGPVSATDVPGPAAASVSCAARGGSLTGVRVVGDLLADTVGDCALVDVVVTGDLVVSARTTVRGHRLTVKRDLRVEGSVVLSSLSVFGGVSLRSGMNQVLSLSDSYVRHSVRGRVPSLGLLRTHVEGAVRITTAHRLTVRGSTIGGWVTSDGGVQVAESTLVRGLTARSTQPSRGDVTILCRSSVGQDVIVIGMRAELEQAPGPNTACPTPDGSSEPGPRSSIGGSLRLVDTYGIRLTHLDVAGDLRCTNLYGTVTVDPDVTVAGERTGACAAQQAQVDAAAADLAGRESAVIAAEARTSVNAGTGAVSGPAPVVPSASYDNCSAARAAGAAPVRIGDPGYGRHLDRDGDGIGCE